MFFWISSEVFFMLLHLGNESPECTCRVVVFLMVRVYIDPARPRKVIVKALLCSSVSRCACSLHGHIWKWLATKVATGIAVQRLGGALSDALADQKIWSNFFLGSKIKLNQKASGSTLHYLEKTSWSLQSERPLYIILLSHFLQPVGFRSEFLNTPLLSSLYDKKNKEL